MAFTDIPPLSPSIDTPDETLPISTWQEGMQSYIDKAMAKVTGIHGACWGLPYDWNQWFWCIIVTVPNTMRSIGGFDTASLCFVQQSYIKR